MFATEEVSAREQLVSKGSRGTRMLLYSATGMGINQGGETPSLP